MYRLFKLFLPTIALIATLFSLQAQAFFLNNVEINGLHGISRDTVISYLPVKMGKAYNSEQSSQIIDALYATGFFNNVSVQRKGNTLIINVVERPTIAAVSVTGSKLIPKDKLDEILKKIGLVQGRLLDKSVLNQLVTQLRNQYDIMGKYSARVTADTVPESNNRVMIRINISEGLTVQIGGISIVGNHVFSEKELLSALPISTRHFWSFLNSSGEYNQAKLSEAIEALQSFYLDRGYLKFKADSTQVTLTPDKKTAHIIIHVTEGSYYTFAGYEVTGHVLLEQSKLQSILNRIKTGEAFSKRKVVDAEQGIKHALGDFGYIFSAVNTLPKVDEKNKTVFLTFYVDPGNQVYVRHINIAGNLKTQDVVFRRLLLQKEGSLFSTSDLKESLRQLNISGLIKQEPQFSTVPVPGYADEVDLNLNVTEEHSSRAMFSLGYGTNGAVLGATLSQNNVFGTGNQLDVNFNNTRQMTMYSIGYNNPYYTLSGIQRGFNVFFQRATPSNLNTTDYSTNVYGGNLNYIIPFDEKGDSLTLAGGLQRLELNLPNPSQLSSEVLDFYNKHGTSFNQFSFTTGWSRNGLDRFLFPENGLKQFIDAALFLPLGGKPLNYYKVTYSGLGYYSLGHDFILSGSLNLGYGNGFATTKELPFFANFYAGGLGVRGQVRGYEISSLGPRDSKGRPLGGNVMTVGSVALYFPMPDALSEKVRTSVFVDAGNIYSTLGVSKPNNPRGGTASGPIRYSAGLDLDWRVPFFNVVLGFSVAKAIHPKPGDQTQVFQFNIGTGG